MKTYTVNENSVVKLDGRNSYDPDGNLLAYNWTQTGGKPVGLTGVQTPTAKFNATTGVSNDTFKLTAKDLLTNLNDTAIEKVMVKHIARPPLPPAGVNSTAVIHAVFDGNLPYFFLAVIASAMVIPLAIDMILAYRKKNMQSANRENSAVVDMPGLYRTLMTFGVILLIGTILFYILTLITLNLNNSVNPVLQSLIDVFKNLATILGTALATIIAFYFGMRGSETAAEKAAVAAIATRASTEDKTPPTVVDTSPGDNDSDVPVNSLVTTSFSNRMNNSTINPDTFTVKKDGTTTNIAGTVYTSPDRKTAIFRAEQNFSPNEKHVATIDKAVKDEAGNALVSTKSWSFKTVSG